jgi:phosphoribosyl-AMP cyclohydrolase
MICVIQFSWENGLEREIYKKMDCVNVDFSKMDGLVPVIAQDSETNEILMVAFVNEKALNLSLSTGYAHYYSRSRKKIWKKGSSSGHTQKITEIRVDCDQDSLIYKVNQKGGACHTGYYSCFYRIVDKRGFHLSGKKIFNPQKIYKF